MLKTLINPCLVQTQPGRPPRRFPLSAGTQSVGREKDNTIVLADPSVSRHHAELVVTEASVRLLDRGSRNGTKVNAMPRKEATLQEGDRVLFGTVELVFSAKAPATGPMPALVPAQDARQMETSRQVLQLPDAKAERHLAAFYHLCAWVTDGVDEADGLAKWLDLIVESLRAQAVQYYDPEGKLAHVALRESEKPRVKFAPYLLDHFRQLSEATAYAPKELDRFQERLGHFHYLVVPLLVAAPAPSTETSRCPVVAVLRPADWEPFSTEDRVLLQSAVQLWLRSGSRAREVSVLKKENLELRARPAAHDPAQLIGRSEVLEKVRVRLERIAATKATVLITGETGSGKEVVAHFIHHRGPRAKQAFIKVNCASIPASLMESELFGHVRGAFTDAQSDHKGRFLLAHGGTLFLDEIGELPLSVQAKLLRVLETGEVERLGSEKTDKVDVRILAATNRELRGAVQAGTFREDLLYRLEVARIDVPPLREHREDIDELAPYFLARFCAENGLAALTLAPDALAALRKPAWPGNVRELRNVVQRLALEADSAVLRAADVAGMLR